MEENLKQLLLKDLCARLPFGVVLDVDTTDWKAPQGHLKVKVEGLGFLFKDMSLIVNGSYYGDKYKPYLRPMSSMTEEEKVEYCNLQGKFLLSSQYPVTDAYELFDWLNKKMFDYRGLIPKDLAIEVTEENNPYEN